MEAVRIADTADAFIAACDEALKMAGSGTAWLKEADMALNQMSWDKTFQAMSRLITPGSAPPRNRRSMCHLLRSGEASGQKNMIIWWWAQALPDQSWLSASPSARARRCC